MFAPNGGYCFVYFSDLLRLNVAIVLSELANAGPTLFRYVALTDGAIVWPGLYITRRVLV